MRSHRANLRVLPEPSRACPACGQWTVRPAMPPDVLTCFRCGWRSGPPDNAEWAHGHSEPVADQVARARRRPTLGGRFVLGVLRGLAWLGALLGGRL